MCSAPAPSCVTTCITCGIWKAPSSTRSTARMCDTGMEEHIWERGLSLRGGLGTGARETGGSGTAFLWVCASGGVFRHGTVNFGHLSCVCVHLAAL